jgi:kynurenine formamidase
MMDADHRPTYDELTGDDHTPRHSTWGLFGEADEVGTLNLIGAAQVTAAARLVRQGLVIPLNWDVDKPSPAVLGRRSPRHTVLRERGGGQDDYYDSFYPQASSQWDALSHACHPEFGYYNGVPAEQTPGFSGHRLGIQAWSRRGIAGRFVLLDVARHRQRQGRPINAASKEEIGVDDLEEVMAAQQVTTALGDILLLRFGWIRWYETLSQGERNRLGDGQQFPAPGLTATEDIACWLWDRGIAAVAADCPALEAMPFDQSRADGFLHYRLIPLLGMAVGELFALDTLADHCARTGVYEGLLVAAPIQKTGGVGSPANAVALL